MQDGNQRVGGMQGISSRTLMAWQTHTKQAAVTNRSWDITAGELCMQAPAPPCTSSCGRLCRRGTGQRAPCGCSRRVLDTCGGCGRV